MRDSQSIDLIVDAWQKLILMYSSSEPEIAEMVLHTLQKYISWMSIFLVVNDKYLPP